MPYTITMIRDSEIDSLPDRDKQVPDYMHGACTKCGFCCAHFECPALDPVSHLCKVYDNRPTACRQWPTQREQISLVNCPGYRYTP